ncbi:hypothetical protein, partial [Priestia megaterium]
KLFVYFYDKLKENLYRGDGTMFGFELICTFCKGLGKLAVIPGIGYMKTCKHCEGTGMQSKKDETPSI